MSIQLTGLGKVVAYKILLANQIEVSRATKREVRVEAKGIF